MNSFSDRKLKVMRKNCVRKHVYILFIINIICVLLTSGTYKVKAQPISSISSVDMKESKMWMTINGHRFDFVLNNNETANAFIQLLPLTLTATELNGNEKYADLPTSLVAHSIRPKMIHAGDIMLYGTNILVVFYKTFRSSYSYTPIGHIKNPDHLPEILNGQTARIAFFKD